jgi:hypothetical protein
MSELRDRLIEVEPLGAERNQKLEQEIRAMLEPKMSRWQRVYWGASAAGGLMFAVCAVPMVLFVPMSTSARMIWGIGGVLNALVAVFLLWRIWKGSMNLEQQFAGGKASFGVAMLITNLLLINTIAQPTLENLAWYMFGITLLVLTATIAVTNQVVAAQNYSREQTLKLEYRLAELVEKLAQGGQGGK